MTHETRGQLVFAAALEASLYLGLALAVIFGLVFVVRFAWELAGGLL